MDNIKVSVKILIMVVIAVVGMAIIGIRGAVSINSGHDQMQRMYDVEMKCVELLGDAEGKMRTIQVRSIQVIADPTRQGELAQEQQKDISEMEKILQEYAAWPRWIVQMMAWMKRWAIGTASKNPCQLL